MELTSTSGPDATGDPEANAGNASLSIFHSSPVAMVIYAAADGAILDANQSFLDLTGWQAEEIAGATAESLGLWPNAEEQRNFHARLAGEQTVSNLEQQLRTRGGGVRTVLAGYTLAPYEETPAVHGFFWDVTERQERASQQAELMELAIALRGGGDSQGVASIAIVYLEEIFQTEGAMIAVRAPDAEEASVEIARGRGDALLAPLYARRLHRRALLQGEPYIGLAHWAMGERPWAYCVPLPAAALNLGAIWLFTAAPLAAAARSLLQTAGNLVAAALHRAQLRSESDEEAQQLRLVLEAMPVGIILLNPRGYVLLANGLGNYYLNLLAGRSIPEPLTHLGGQPLSYYSGATGNNPRHDIAISDRLLAVRLISTGEENANQIVVMTDVTEVRRLQSQQLVESRLASVGRLAAGIAHEFNNVMASVALDAELLLREAELPSTATRRLQRIHDQVQRGARLVQQVLDFGERSLLNRQLLALGELVREMAGELREALPEGTQLILPQAGDFWVHGDRLRLQTLLRNLTQNAAEAMPSGGELELTLAYTRGEELGPDLAQLDMEEQPERWVRLAVRDTGVGIAPRDIDRLFDPFFTTANPLAHRGLGLPQAYGIARQHGGLMRVSSAPGAGATFTVYVPAADAPS
ncbi:MAG: ATP-binding protein [Anaerolineae bacterium]|nr:ATP-binding protein [Anaerolineae bacterium]